MYKLPFPSLFVIFIMFSCGEPVVDRIIPKEGISFETYTDKQKSLIKLVENSLQSASENNSKVYWSLTDRMAHHNVPAVSIAVINNYEIDWARAYGWSNKEDSIRATPKTLFQAASMSKSLNAMGVLNWAEKNGIDLESNINNILESWKLESRKDSNGKEVSLANILSHTGGISVNKFDGYNTNEELPSTKEILEGSGLANSRQVIMDSDPGQEFLYSGGGITITQFLLEKYSNTSYDNYIQKSVLDPLEMMESTFSQKPIRDD